jgi:hypothetical protein
MSAQYVEFARGLELVCHHLNPPSSSDTATLRLSDLALDGTLLKADDPGIAYRYVRGVELPGRAESPLQSKPIWAAERGLLAVATAASEIEPGTLAIGDELGVVRVFVRAGRGRWECAASLRSHLSVVRDICKLEGEGFASVGDDGAIAIHRRDPRGVWQRSFLDGGLGASPLTAVCQLSDGRAIAAGRSATFELKALPSGDWQRDPLWLGTPDIDVTELAAYGENKFCAALRDGGLRFFERSPDGLISVVSGRRAAGAATDVTAWRGDIVACTDAGEIMRFAGEWESSGAELIPSTVERVAGTAILKIEALDAERIVTWSSDQQIRIWAIQNDRFVLRAALPSRVSAPCIAPLCDGRVGYSDMRGFNVAMPQLDGVWRNEEAVSTYEAGVTAVAPLGAQRVAYLDGQALRIVTFSGERASVTDVPIGQLTIASMVAYDESALILKSAAGTLHIARDKAGLWTLDGLSRINAPGIGRIAASNPFVAIADGAGVLHVCQMEGLGLNERTVSLGRVSALAMNSEGLFAAAGPETPLYVADFQAPEGNILPAQLSPAAAVAELAWDRDSLIILLQTGEITRIRFAPPTQEPLGWAPSSAPPAQTPQGWAASPVPGHVMTPLHTTRSDSIAVASGASVLYAGPGWPPLGAHRADIRALASAGERLYAAADALYVFDLGMMPPSVERIVVTDQVILEAELSITGPVRSAVIRRRDSAPWKVTTVGGRALPNDPLLHASLAVLDTNGQLTEVFTSKNFFFSSDLKELHIEDPDVPRD